MDDFRDYVVQLIKVMAAGTTEDYPAPDPPEDLGDPLTQDDIDFVKKLRKDIGERFITE